MRFRPANSIFDGVIMPSVRGAVKNHNARKGPVLGREKAMDFHESMAFYLSI